MTPGRFKCTQFRLGALDFSLECIQLLQNYFFNQQYIIFDATIPGQDRIYPNTHLCRTFCWVYEKIVRCSLKYFSSVRSAYVVNIYLNCRGDYKQYSQMKIKTKMSSFKSSDNIQKEGGPDRSVSDNQSSSVTLIED